MSRSTSTQSSGARLLTPRPSQQFTSAHTNNCSGVSRCMPYHWTAAGQGRTCRQKGRGARSARARGRACGAGRLVQERRTWAMCGIHLCLRHSSLPPSTETSRVPQCTLGQREPTGSTNVQITHKRSFQQTLATYKHLLQTLAHTLQHKQATPNNKH